MRLKAIIDEDFNDYKLPSLFLAFPCCTFKCDKEGGQKVCQNSTLAQSPNIEVDVSTVIDRYMDNPITKAVVCGGLEPFDAPDALHNLIESFRCVSNDDIVVYTGYTKDEIVERFKWVYDYHNMIIKYGRFMLNKEHHFDKVLGVELASSNQWAERIE